jgi:murein DD-endopeptidase MepM/ murein hydrolase activator NlpD
MVEARSAEVVTGHRCAQCGGATPLRTPHVQIDGGAVRTFCSASCASGVLPLARALPEPAPRRLRRRFLVALLLAPLLLFTSGRAARVVTPPPSLVGAQPAALAPPVEDPALFGPHWPPTDRDWMAEISSDAWVHPLDGPSRRMPISDGRVFGAERQGDRPGECNNGHCGVDLSGPWGERVHAVHDGVVDRVQRGPNEEHGGLYVRIAHRDGTIFSQYFHLAAIPRHLEPGVRVKVGEVVGLLGDTGVKHSQPHLHFALSVRPSAQSIEKYMDPEPLIALWPLRIPLGEASESPVTLTTHVAPGVPHGAARKHHKVRRAEVAPVDDPPAAAE